MQVGLSQSTPPHRVSEAQRPVGMRLSLRDPAVAQAVAQAVAAPVFRASAGSGLVIPCLARFQPMPSRSTVCRMASPVTRRGVRPWAKLPSAARSSVHRLLGWPKSRGRRCTSARTCSARSSEKARGGGWCGREEPRGNASSRLKRWRSWRTGFSSQPTSTAICGARSPRALASSIWQRRTTTPSDERRPVFRVVRSSSVSARTKMGGLIPPRIPHSDLPSLRLH